MSRGAKGWDDERVKRLKEYCERGMLASEIAAAFGDTSRCAVIGQAYRRGFRLPGMNTPKPKQYKAAKPKKKPKSAVEEVAEDETPLPRRKKIRPQYDVVRTKAEYQQMLAEAVRNTKKLQDAD